MTKLNRTVAEVEADRLVAAACFTRSCGVTVAAGQGVLKRGSVLGVNSDNKCILLGAQNEDEEVIEAEARYILNEDCDATDADTVAIAYEEGRFIKQQLIVAEGYELTAADIDALRVHNIGLEDEV